MFGFTVKTATVRKVQAPTFGLTKRTHIVTGATDLGEGVNVKLTNLGASIMTADQRLSGKLLVG